MAIPVIESSTTIPGTGVVTQPSGLAVDDLILILVATDQGNTNSLTVPSGYTGIASTDNANDVQVCTPTRWQQRRTCRRGR